MVYSRRLFALMLILFGSVSAALFADTRIAELRLSLTSADGSPLQGLLLTIWNNQHPTLIITNGRGLARTRLRLTDTTDAVRCEIGAFHLPPGAHPLRGRERKNLEAALTKNVFARSYTIAINPDGITEAAITADTGVQLTAQIVGGRAQHILVADQARIVTPDEHGSFTTLIREAHKARLFLVTDQPAIQTVLIPAVRTTAPLNLGTIRLQPPSSDAPTATIVAAVNWWLDDEPRTESTQPGLTLIAEGGSALYSFPLGLECLAVAEPGQTTLPRVPPGTYVALPGRFNASPAQTAAIDALASGRLEKLTDAGVPVLTASPGQAVAVTVSAPHSIDAICRASFDALGVPAIASRANPAGPAPRYSPNISDDPPAIPYPHPLITEILYAVPTGDTGDANGDGTRHPSSDEFIELINPHSRPIQLNGYSLTDSNTRGGGHMAFTFPPLKLPPGAVVVVFNGYNANWTGPVGDTQHAPPGPNPNFHNALVFSMNARTSYASLANDGDWVMLNDPADRPVSVVYWGEIDPPTSVPIVEQAPKVWAGSVTRHDGAFIEHPRINGVPFSPGRHPPPSAPAPEPDDR